MTHPVVKVCGVTVEDEVRELGELGVDLFGLVIAPGFPWTLLPERAKDLAATNNGPSRPTLIAHPTSAENLERLIVSTRVKAIQLGVLSLPKYVARIRSRFRREELTIIQTIPYRGGRFVNEEHLDAYLDAGANFILIDQLEKAVGCGSASSETIPEEALVGFRHRHPGRPILVAGSVSAVNAPALMAASGAIGVDVCSSVRRDGRIHRELVARLLEQIAAGSVAPPQRRPSLRGLLNAIKSGNNIIAYLTIGDPPHRFVEVAQELLDSGALTLELGLPCSDPKEGSTLRASHQRALAAGVDAQAAMTLLRAVAQANPRIPLIAVVHRPSIQGEAAGEQFLDGLADAGAAAILPVGMPLWEFPAFAARAREQGLETVFPCPPNASTKYRAIVFRYCSGAVYVPGGPVTGGSVQFDDLSNFCRLVARETELPMIGGVGVKSPEDVAAICRTPAKAAAVGSALVDHIARHGSARHFLQQLGVSRPIRSVEPNEREPRNEPGPRGP